MRAQDASWEKVSTVSSSSPSARARPSPSARTSEPCVKESTNFKPNKSGRLAISCDAPEAGGLGPILPGPNSTLLWPPGARMRAFAGTLLRSLLSCAQQPDPYAAINSLRSTSTMFMICLPTRPPSLPPFPLLVVCAPLVGAVRD